MEKQLNWQQHAKELSKQLWAGKRVPGSFGTHGVKKIAVACDRPGRPKYLIAQPVGKMAVENYWRIRKGSKVLAVYPRVEDAENFAGNTTPISGMPRKYFNGSIGVIHAWHEPYLAGFGGQLHIDFVEGTPVRMVEKLTKAKSKEYLHWREHLYDWLFAFAKRRRVKTLRFRVTFDEFDKKRGGISDKLFVQKAAEHGFEVEEPTGQLPGAAYYITATRASRQTRH